ncbi:MAG: ABC transporter substrate-binding protein [Pyrinomonadaceae bacterium]
MRLAKYLDFQLAACLLFVALLLTGCSRDAIYVEIGPVRSPATPPQRIISLSPSATEVLYGVGAFERVVAVSDYDTFPPEAQRLPKIGGWSNTNLEQVTALRPDLVVMAGAQAPFVKDKLDALNIPVLVVPDRSIEDALASIEQIGRAVGREAEAKQLLDETRAKLERIREGTKGLPRVRVLCVVDRVPGTLRGLYIATEGSFIAQLIEVAGGQSIAPPAAGGFGQISKEAIVSLDPEVIIDMVQSLADSKLAEDPRAVWGELGQVKAVREGRVYPVRDNSVLHPSQFVGDTAQKFAALIHPEAWTK